MMGLAYFVQTHSAPWRKLSRVDLARRAFDEGCKISDRQWSKRCADVREGLAHANDHISKQANELAEIRHKLRRFEAIEGRISASLDATWHTAYRGEIRVQAMAGSHLFFAIAKCLRGGSANRPITHLQNEALRRLVMGVL